MKHKYIFLICFGLFILACKSDKNTDNHKDEAVDAPIRLTENEKLLQGIQNAYNSKKFKDESQVKFNIKLSVADTLFYDGYISLKTDVSQIRLTSSKIDTVLTSKNLKLDYYKTLFLIAESYALPFLMKSNSFQKQAENDSLEISNYNSNFTKSKFKISTNPLTNIIQKIDYETDITYIPFKTGQIYFERYITVNRIPVAMQWRIEVDNKVMATAEINRISYPKVF